MNADNAKLDHAGSHFITDDRGGGSRAEGFTKEEVYLYFIATWREKPVSVTVAADRYAHSSGMSDWRVYARDVHYIDPERNGGRGEPATDTARGALGKLCVPLAMAWLDSDEYRTSFKAALGYMIVRKFDDCYSASRDVAEALATFSDRLSPDALAALRAALNAYNVYSAAKAHVAEVIA